MAGKTLVVAVSDTHINSAVALAAPSYTRTDGNEIRANARQLYLWERWCELARVVTGYRHHGWRTVLLHLGDIAEFDAKGRTYRLMTNEAIEERIPGDASAAEVAAKMGWSWTKARDTLRQMVRAGQATEHTVRAPKGGTMTVYRLIKCEPPGG